MTSRILIFCIVALAVTSSHSFAQETPKHFSRSFEIPKSIKNNNFANNEDAPAMTTRQGRNRHERLQGRNRNINKTDTTTEARTAAQNVNTDARKGRRQTAQQNRNRARQITPKNVNDLAKELLNY